MPKSAATTQHIGNWCDKSERYRDARAAIRGIDLTVESFPDEAERFLGTAWTALTILINGRGIIAPDWLPVCARFYKLSAAERVRVRDAVDMRLRAVAA